MAVNKDFANDLLHEIRILLLDVQDAIDYMESEDYEQAETYCRIIADRGANVDDLRRKTFIDEDE